MYLIGILSGEGVNFLSSFACSFGFLSSGGGMSGKDSSESVSSGSVLKSVINLFPFFEKCCIIVLNNYCTECYFIIVLNHKGYYCTECRFAFHYCTECRFPSYAECIVCRIQMY